MSLTDKHFPNESDEYRQARDKLLEEELKLRQKVVEIAEQRQALPDGGKIKEDYVFDELTESGEVKQTKLSELFAGGKDSLIIYSYMYGPNIDAPCPSCTSLIDTMNANVDPITDKVNMVVVAKSPIERIRKFANTRGWNKVRLLSSANNTYNTDYFAEDAQGNQMPMCNVYKKTADGIFHFFGTELLYAKVDGHPRHMDMVWPIWNFFDMTPEGRGDWNPKLKY